MKEDRLITLILWLVLVLGIAALGAVYLATSTHHTGNKAYPPAPQLDAPMPDVTIEKSPTFSEPLSSDTPPPREKTPKKKSPAVTPPPQRPQVTIQETSKPNGAFSNAQEITEGLVIGGRKTKGDRADFYILQATGNAMTLNLKTSPKEANDRFALTVFDGDRKSILGPFGESSFPLTIMASPQSTYYIKLNLNNAPLKTPRYHLSIKFN